MRRCAEWLGLALAAASLAGAPAAAQAWRPVGPPGGDVRALAASPRDPRVLYLGTAHGVLYRSDDGGLRWQRLAPGFPQPGMSLDNVVVTPAGEVLVGYWRVATGGGGVARSSDGGRSFAIQPGIEGESVRALALHPADPGRLVAGTLTGVFASKDGGASWRRISPAGHAELRNVESVAFDPADAEAVYAGTWHLPWKTLDGGGSWRPISAGMIDDSDVFTMTPDVKAPRTVYATACTGIYRSLDAGSRWTKLRGIPASSRRTRAFAQDPERPELLYAGTTEGLWASEDGGASWTLRTAKELVVNAVAVLPGGGLMLGCDGAGVLRSSDRGRSFSPANEGFSARFVSRLVDDRERGRLLAVVQDDRFHAGVLHAPRPEGPWSRLAPGIEGREVTALALLGSDLVAGTDDGLFALPSGAAEWRRLRVAPRGEAAPAPVADLLALPPRTLLAATERGLLRSADGGESWDLLALGVARRVSALVVSPRGQVLAATPLGLYASGDAGASFRFLSPGPPDLRIGRFAFAEDGERVFASTPTGLFRSSDGGRYWERLFGLHGADVTGLAVRQDGRTIYAADFTRGGLFRSTDGGDSWSAFPTEGLVPDRVWSIAIDPLGPGTLIAATASGGLHLFAPAAAASAPAPR